MSLPDKHLAQPDEALAGLSPPVATPMAAAKPANHPALRQLGGPQMAFVRSWAEGLDLVAAWNRYLYVDGAGDARRARGELQHLLERLRQLARIHGKPEVAALLRRDPQAMPESGPKVPTLQAFAAQQPADFYSEAELLALYQEVFGQVDSRSTARRRQRLRERLVSAVQWLEQVGARAPQPADPVHAWLDERIAQRLAVVGIRTLHELVFWIRTKGFHWHRGIPRIGPEGAARIVRWLGEHQASLGALPSPALVPLSQIDTTALTPPPRIGIVPLERFMPPSGRDGSQGTNRAPTARCKVAAANDYEAIQAWLRLRVQGTHTWRAYRKEGERFLLWAVLERRKALSSLDGDDCVAYRDFLAAPGSEWTGPRNAQRWSEAWRPFEGPLSVRSQAAAMTIVRSLCAWLVRRQYLDSNPWDEVPARPDAPSMPQLRALSQKQWSLVQGWLADELARAPSPALHRLQFLLNFGYMTGMRLAELAAAKLATARAARRRGVGLVDHGAGQAQQVARGATARSGRGRAAGVTGHAWSQLGSIGQRSCRAAGLQAGDGSAVVGGTNLRHPGRRVRALRGTRVDRGQTGCRTDSGGVNALAAAHLWVSLCGARRTAGRPAGQPGP